MIKKTFATSSVLLAIAFGAALAQDKGGKGGGKAPPAPGMALTSSDFMDGGIIPDQFTQAAGPTSPSPKLAWTNVPMGTVAFTLIFHDPDGAPGKNSEDVLHWMAFNIPGSATGLMGGQPVDSAQLPDGTTQAKNRGGKNGYMGPGNGAQNPYHHYTFELYALDTKLTLGADATRADVLKAMDGHIIGKAVLVGRFRRPS